jgi:hypothetical protein
MTGIRVVKYVNISKKCIINNADFADIDQNYIHGTLGLTWGTYDIWAVYKYVINYLEYGLEYGLGYAS